MRVQEALGDVPMWARGDGWQWAGALRRGRQNQWLYVQYGPRAEHLAESTASIASAARAASVDFARVEPDTDRSLNPADFQAVPANTGHPRHTLLIDLTRSEEDLRSEMTSGRRRSINTASKKGVSIRRSFDPADVEVFIDMIHKTGERNRFHPHPDSYYRTVCSVLLPQQAASIYVAEHEGAPVAAVVSFASPTTAYYTYAAADAERSRKIIAAAPLAWQMILDARAEGRTTFDFWGVIADDAVDHPWAGFSEFKKTFGGTVLSRPGPWDFPVRKLKYRLYRLARKLLRDDVENL